MNEISHKIDVWRHLLHNELSNTTNLSNDKILKLSRELDEVIVEEYRQELNINKN